MSRLSFPVTTIVIILFSFILFCGCKDITDLSEGLQPPGKAMNPQPPDGSDRIPLSPVLAWKPGKNAYLFHVYLGTNISSLEFRGTVAEPLYTVVEELNWPVTHYWRVDSINSAGITTGDTWRFTTFPAPPVADFVALSTKGFVPLAVNFTNLSKGIVSDWKWDFDNNGTLDSTVKNPSHLYDLHGMYTVKLTVEGPGGIDSMTKSGYVTANTTLIVPLDYSTIQAAVDASFNGDVVLVRNGTYTGPGNRGIDFGGRAIIVRSETGPASCIIDCEGEDRGFYLDTGEGPGSVIDGFTVQNGMAEDGGAIYCGENTSPVIRNCVLNNNTSFSNEYSAMGGAIYCRKGSSPLIDRCTMEGNLANAPFATGGAIYCGDYTSPVIRNCKIIGNTATSRGGGVQCICWVEVEITNCQISGNSSPRGGGINLTRNTILEISNCTIVDNTASETTGGILSDKSSQCLLSNTILWGNESLGEKSQYCGDNTSVAAFSYCCLDEGVSGPSWYALCNNSDPMFVDGSIQDYHLEEFSPCVNAGSNYLLPEEIVHDLDENHRIVGLVVDIGAYEYESHRYAWTHRAGGNNHDQVSSCCTDQYGNLYFAGSFSRTADFGEDWDTADPKSSAGATDCFVTAISHAGDYLWTHRIGGSSHDYAHSVCVDPSGNIYVAGDFKGTVNFAEDWNGSDVISCQGTMGAFITKISPDGDYCWSHTVSAFGYDHAYDVCSDTEGNVYLVGRFAVAADFGASWNMPDVKTSVGSPDAYITKIDKNGEYCWTRRIGNKYGNDARCVCTDSDDNVYVGGECSGWFLNFAEDWGGSDVKVTTISPVGYITKIDSDGNYRWTQVVGGGFYTARVNDVCCDSSGNLYATGWDSPGILLAKYNPQGYIIWKRNPNFDDMNDRVGLGICCAGDDSVYLSGYFSDSVDFARGWGGTNVITSQGGYDAFITRVDTSGDYSWTRRIGGWDTDLSSAVCSDTSGNIYFAGEFGYTKYALPYTVNFAEDWGGNDSKTSLGRQDGFITKLEKAYGQ